MHCVGSPTETSAVEGVVTSGTLPRQLWAAAHLATSIAGPSPFEPKQNFQQVCPLPHFFSQA
jgi:hypothetical protein